MTREESIAILDGFKHNPLFNEQHFEALDMAISALSAEPCREADDYENEIADLHNRLDIAEYDKERYKEEITILEAENKEEWIPVSERLPEEREWYLAVFKEKDTNFHLIPRVADYIGHGENRWRLIDEEGLTQKYRDLLECVAWQPLPEPYKADMRGDT